MDFANFISGGNEKDRLAMWKHYNLLADYFINDLQFTPTVVRVTEGPAQWTWLAEGQSEIQVPRGDVGAMWHEQAHDLFHHSPLYWTNEKWGESICDAIRWIMGNHCNNVDKQWRRHFNGAHVKRARQIIDHCGTTLPQFAKGWHRLCGATCLRQCQDPELLFQGAKNDNQSYAKILR